MVAALEPLELLEHARRGPIDDTEGVRAFVTSWTDGAVGDPQMAALCMAACIHGLSRDATHALHDALVASGDRLQLERFGPSGDVPSTGAVGDAVALVAAPLAAALGVRIASIGGRGMGHTGGLFDKLSSIPGVQIGRELVDFVRQIRDVGIATMAPSNRLVPAERRLHTLRDQTGTVESPALLAASMMSTMIAAGAVHLAVDIPVGPGGLMPTLAEAREAAQIMVQIGEAWDREVHYILSDVSQPRGRTVGNALEIRGAGEVLRGGGANDLADLAVQLAALVAESAGVVPPGAGVAEATDALDDGRALLTAERWVEAQGGDPAVWTDDELLPTAPLTLPVTAPREGAVGAIDPREIGEVARWIGAGRLHPAQFIDPAVGIEMHVRVGDAVVADQPLATVHVRDAALGEGAVDRLAAAFRIVDGDVDAIPLIHETSADE